eukprot:2736492-Amphidinium_carterae.2
MARGSEAKDIWRQQQPLLGDMFGVWQPLESHRTPRREAREYKAIGGGDDGGKERQGWKQGPSCTSMPNLQHRDGSKDRARFGNCVLGMQSIPCVPVDSTGSMLATTGGRSDGVGNAGNIIPECSGDTSDRRSGARADVGRGLREFDAVDALDAYLEHDLPWCAWTSLLKPVPASATYHSTDVSSVEASMSAIYVVESDSAWYTHVALLDDVEGLWITHTCDVHVGRHAKERMQAVGGIYLIETCVQPGAENILDWLGPYTCKDKFQGQEHFWIQTNSVECARLFQKGGTVPDRKRVRRGIAVSLREKGFGLGKTGETRGLFGV